MLQLLSPSNSVAPCSNNVANQIYPEKGLKASIKRISSANAHHQQQQQQQHDEGADEKVAVFHRQEITIGELVGTGSFSEVYEIASFDLMEKEDDENTPDGTGGMKRRLSNSFRTKSSATPTIGPSRRRKRDLILAHHNLTAQKQQAGTTQQSQFVIKHLAQKLMEDPKLFRRAVRDLTTEVALMQDLKHPHIAQLRGTAFDGAAAMADGKHDSFFLVLDRLHETLDNRIDSWNRDKAQQGPSYYLESSANESRIALKANYGWQIASALDFLHQRRVIFRDLKPQNIGFKEIHPEHPERDILALFDFGLARNLPVESKANKDGMFHMSLVGTRRYMAPEVVLTKTYGVLADTYSWALVFFEMITQQRPFDGIQRNEHKEYICRQGKRPKLYSYYYLPKELEIMLRLSWAQDVSRRLPMSEVCQTLKAFLKGTIHENAVLPCMDEEVPNGTYPLLRDTSFSSMNSTETTETEQSTSTVEQPSAVDSPSTNTEVTNNEANAGVSPTRVLNLSKQQTNQAESPINMAFEIAPQPINVVSVETSIRDDAAYYTTELKVKEKQTSFCRRLLSFFRRAIIRC